MALYPEGCTSNGDGMIQFKKGAFASLLPVQPFCIRYKNLRCRLQHGDATHYHSWIIYSFQVIASIITYDELPVFEPNEYFWQHHWDGQEDKWKAYARAVRQIIAEQGDFQLFDVEMEDKLEYKKYVKSVGKAAKATKMASDDDLKPLSKPAQDKPNQNFTKQD